MNNKNWLSKHPNWLKKSKHRCAMFPWISISQVRGKYYPYDVHHTNYKRVGDERYWFDVLPLSRFAHRQIMHGILSGFKRPRQQKYYPNFFQSLAHHWCRLMLLLR